MIGHIGIYVDDIEKAKAFYAAALAPLGYAVLKEFPEWSVIGLGVGENADLWISQREANHNVHVALTADSKEMVQAFHAAGVSAGGSDNGAPGYRKEYAPGYYGAFITDPFGNNIEAVFQDLNPGE